ncbi:DUF4397 domain-containing protein [Corallococcus sp. M34]|uniref:DUF4397 domain-containing protein n=1 Tax=Citreicoccus inhibens TaxID=2849499 RepID=UPI00131504B3|nr:DUF4397 domain-containing protein [Citreicoccus inhibens]MBU8895715.1 DUF4397 domain-containing protein [Citreicoccus inhibens]
MNRTRCWKALLVTVQVGLMVLVAGCNRTEVAEAPPPPPPPIPERPLVPAQIRVLHASPDAPPVDVYVEGSTRPLAVRVAYGSTTTYATLPPGDITVELRASGSAATTAPLLTTHVTLEQEARWTVVVAGLFAGHDPASVFRALSLREPPRDAVAPDQAQVRLVNAGVDAPTLGFDVGDDGTVDTELLERFASTGDATGDVPAGEPLQLGVVLGTNAEHVTSFTLPPLVAGTQTLIVATGLMTEPARAGNGFSLLMAGRDGTLAILRQNPVVYAVHASPDAPTMELFAGARALFAPLSFGTMSGPVQVPPGEYTLDAFGVTLDHVRPAGAPAASSRTPELVAGERYLLVASGYLAPPTPQSPAFTLLPFAEGFSHDSSNVLVRLVHAAPSSPAVDVGLVGPEQRVLQDAPFVDQSFGGASAASGLPLPPDNLLLGVTPSSEANRYPRARFHLDSGTRVGQRLFAVAANPPGGSDAWSLRLLLVDTAPTPWTLGALLPEK